MINKLLKGMCYSAFPFEYDPSTANKTCIFFGSDIATNNLKPLWGKGFSPVDGPDNDKIFLGRDDLYTLSKMGVNIIRLYDWDSRNNHLQFLDYCKSLGIKVLVPVSNYNLGAFGTPPNMDESITNLIHSFSNKEKTDYHSAIYGILIGSELDLPSKMPIGYLAEYTKRWVEIEQELFSKFTELPIGHPVSFAKFNRKYPCFAFWDDLLSNIGEITVRNLDKRLILCPNTYNEASYLFDNAEGTYRGWVDLAYDKYKLPILFSEIGCSRLVREDYNDVIAKQLERSGEYQRLNPTKLLGMCFFQFCDKSWMINTTEGAFGTVYNSTKSESVIRYGAKDFTHNDGNNCEKQLLRVQILKNNPVFNTVKLIYTANK